MSQLDRLLTIPAAAKFFSAVMSEATVRRRAADGSFVVVKIGPSTLIDLGATCEKFGIDLPEDAFPAASGRTRAANESVALSTPARTAAEAK